MLERTSHLAIKAGSNRGFGLVFTVFFLVVSVWPLMGDGQTRVWSLALAAIIAGVALVSPNLMAPFNVMWFRFAMLLNAVVSPLVMGSLFLVTVTPTALVIRMLGKDPLQRKIDKDAASYWVARNAPMGSMKNQF